METTLTQPEAEVMAELADRVSAQAACFHCGLPCPDASIFSGEKVFCCNGCLAVHRLLCDSGLGHFYDLGSRAGQPIKEAQDSTRWAFLDEPETRDRVLDYSSPELCRVTFSIPAIHCIACVWLLENLFRLHAGIGQSTANFLRREVSIAFAPQKIRLGELAALLASIGYEPAITLNSLEKGASDPASRKQWLQTGIAAFAFGNIMLMTLPLYMGLDTFSGPALGRLFGWVSLAMALPVVTYSASDYWKSALGSLRQRTITLDVPIVLGLAALYIQSAYEILFSSGGGYLDSLCGLVFFLLCGRIFQRKTHDRIAFDRDYKSFFPLATTRLKEDVEESISISAIELGDRLLVRHGELVPADGKLLSEQALVDYSFVTGESEPVEVQRGSRLYAGGKQMVGAIQIETVKPVSQSYLASLWNHKAFKKEASSQVQSLTNRYSRQFTKIVIAVACLAALGWCLAGQGERGLKAFTSVLIVACPCALALAAPFALGSAQRVLARVGVFVRGPLVLERLSEVTTIVFDKTGTLTAPGGANAEFKPCAGKAAGIPWQAVRSVAAQSSHPHARAIAAALSDYDLAPVSGFRSESGEGVSGEADGVRVLIGSAAWLRRHGIELHTSGLVTGSLSHVAIDGEHAGTFTIRQALREEAGGLLARLRSGYELALLSGDNERERERFRALLGDTAPLLFNRSPVEKLEWIQSLKNGNRTVMMVGDGLNDAGALKSSDVGVAVVDRIGSFSPASDLLIEAKAVRHLDAILTLSRRAVRVVRLSFAISAAYNVIGITIAAAGVLSPLICAVLMPLSSLSVVLIASGMTTRAGNQLELSANN